MLSQWALVLPASRVLVEQGAEPLQVERVRHLVVACCLSFLSWFVSWAICLFGSVLGALAGLAFAVQLGLASRAQ